MVIKANHPAVLKFPAQAAQIAERVICDEEFAGICSDYAEIVGEIADTERAPSGNSAVLTHLLQLRKDLEKDLCDKLGMGDNNET